MEPTTFWCPGRHSNPLSHPARARSAEKHARKSSLKSSPSPCVSYEARGAHAGRSAQAHGGAASSWAELEARGTLSLFGTLSKRSAVSTALPTRRRGSREGEGNAGRKPTPRDTPLGLLCSEEPPGSEIQGGTSGGGCPCVSTATVTFDHQRPFRRKPGAAQHQVPSRSPGTQLARIPAAGVQRGTEARGSCPPIAVHSPTHGRSGPQAPPSGRQARAPGLHGQDAGSGALTRHQAAWCLAFICAAVSGTLGPSHLKCQVDKRTERLANPSHGEAR